MLEKIINVDWQMEVEPLVQDYGINASPIFDFYVFFENGTSKNFKVRVGDKWTIEDLGNCSSLEIDKIMKRISPKVNEIVDDVINRIGLINKYGKLDEKFWEQFWVDDAMGK